MVNTKNNHQQTWYNPKLASLGYQKRPFICRHSVASVFTSVLRCMLSAYCASAKVLGPMHPVVGKYKCFPALLGCLYKEIAVETHPLLRIAVWAKTAKYSYPKLAVGAKFSRIILTPWLSSSISILSILIVRKVYLLLWWILEPPIALFTVSLFSS